MHGQPRKVSAPPVSKPVPEVETVASLFGGAMAVNTNYQLKGIVLANPRNQSDAIIAVDGKPSQAFTVNSEISPGIKLTEVHAGYVMILDNGVSKRVELPAESSASMQIGDGDNGQQNQARLPPQMEPKSQPKSQPLRKPLIPPGSPVMPGQRRMNYGGNPNTPAPGQSGAPGNRVPMPAPDRPVQ